MMAVIYPSNYDDHHLCGRCATGAATQNRAQRGDTPMTDHNAPKKIALVTGASSGIGEATADRLARAGHKAYGASGGARPLEMLSLDVPSDSSVNAAINELVRLEGGIDLLVNNAGFGIAPAGAEETSIEQAQSIFDANFFGIVRMTRAVVPHMRHGGGRIINIGSVLGF